MEVILIVLVAVVGAWAVAKFGFDYDLLQHLPKGEGSKDDSDPFEPKN